MQTRTRAGTAALGVATLLLTSLAPLAAVAAEGPPPAGTERQVLSRLHTDAVSTFLTDGTFELGSKADLPEGNGTRVDPSAVLFHVDDDARVQVPPTGFDFIAPAGSTIWMAPETNPSGPGGYTQLWPGFSTESVPAGALRDDRTTFTLTAFDGPGDLELFTSGALGQPNRLWSTDEDRDTFTVGRTHMHANWAFTAAGTYTLSVRATAVTAAGTTVTAGNAYTFVVGPLAEPTATTTTLTAAPAAVVPGEAVQLTAAVAPASAAGWVEFLDGTTTLGHAEVAGGTATLEVRDLPLGTRSLTARFAPAVLNDAAGSTSAAQTVTVTEQPGGDEFAVIGVQPSYSPGQTLTARVVGASLDEGQMYRWLWRPTGSTSTGSALQTSDSGTLSRVVTASDTGYELSVAIRTCSNASCSSGTVAAQTAWTPVVIAADGTAPVLTRAAGEGPLYPGDTIRLTAAGLDLAPGETAEFVYRLGTTWGTRLNVTNYTTTSPDATSVEVSRVGTNANDFQVAVRVLRDGIAVRQSAPFAVTSANFELPVTGLQTLYFEGTDADLSAQIYPVRAQDAFVYAWQFSQVATFDAGHPSTTVWGSGTDVPATVRHRLTVAEHDGGYLRVRALLPDGTQAFTSAAVRLHVTDDPDAQLFFLEDLAGHYHQGDTVGLALTMSPEAQPGDDLRWEWLWPGSSQWRAVPGASGTRHPITAEQALDGVQVRVVLDHADPDRTDSVTEPVTIHVDDHGAAPVQKAGITGLQPRYRDGDSVTLTAQVAPASVLSRWEWYLQRPGSDTPALLDDTLTSELAFTATEALDGAAVFARLTFDDGRTYVESPPVLLAVDAAEPGEPEPTDPGTTDPTDPGTTDPGTTEPAKPSTAPAVRTGVELDGVAAGGVALSTTAPRQGEVLTVDVGAAHARQWVAAWMFSTPTLLGGDWQQVGADGTLAVRIPADAPAGAHRIAVFAADGALVGWAAVDVRAATGAAPTDTLAATGGTAAPLLVVAVLLLAGAAGVLVARRGSARRRV